MLFNSIPFGVFFLIIFFLYWFVAQKNLKIQNLLLLVSSYFFYGCWDYRFLFLLIFSTLLDFFTGLMMSRSEKQAARRFWFWLSVCINLGFLGFFKYYNFFIGSFTEMLAHFGVHANYWTLSIILPVGISFYTFHGLSYVIDIYKKKIEPERNFVDYAVFVSFFPLLVAGPIERATHLLPQIKTKRTFDHNKAVDGLKQVLWGLFKKIIVADTAADFVNKIWAHPFNYSGSTLVVAAVFFALQIYCDFSGYSDIALGVARLLGIELLRNFAFPYFARDIAEFWRRWHISLTTWFRDYLYIPLGGSKGGTWMKIRNTFIIFLVSGFWHGANWTFLFWGFLNALYFLPLLMTNRNRNNIEIVAKGRLLPSFKDILNLVSTFVLVDIAWIFFRSNTIKQAFGILGKIFSRSLFAKPKVDKDVLITFVFIIFFMLIEWMGREQNYALETFGAKWKRPVRWAFYYSLIIAICIWGGREQKFIYFQF